ncbi:MAG: cytochrome c [Vicinamibacterales bacterium]
MRRRALLLLLAAFAAGCHNMERQSRYDPLEASELFPDGRSARLPVTGTVPRGGTADRALETGRTPAGAYVARIPVPVTADLLRTGEERFDIYCSPCHSRTGDGTGMVARRGYRQPPSFHDPRLLDKRPGYVYEVLTHGYGAMPPYDYLLDPRERWAVVAYIRVLQLLGPKVPAGDAEVTP